MAYIDATPIIPNTTMQIYVDGNGVQRVYFITPNEGYVLHDSRKDYTDIVDGEEVTFEGYTRYGVSVALSYDFTANPNNIYAVLENEVPADQIFGGGNEPETEVM